MTPTVWVDFTANFTDSVVNKGLPLFIGSTNPKQGYLGVGVAPQGDSGQNRGETFLHGGDELGKQEGRE